MTISSDDFRDVLRHFAAGVTVLTAAAGGRRKGMTVSAFTSVSAEPPLVAVVVDRVQSINPLLQGPEAAFAVNILTAHQADLSDRFAYLKDEDRFRRGRWTTAVTGAPVLEDALAWLDCTVSARHPAGSHTIYVGEVRASRVPRPAAAPLVYWNRGYRRLSEPAEAS